MDRQPHPPMQSIDGAWAAIRAHGAAWLFLLLACVAARPAGAEPLPSGEPQRFEFRGAGVCADRPITVHYFRPKGAGADAPVLFAIHGVERDGQRAMQNWIPFAEKHPVVVVAPEFDLQRYPNRWFQMGGMQERAPEKMTFALIEQLFDKLRRDEGLTTPTYLLFGHSAGAQFVHRLALVADKPRFSMAVAANAGSYTLPVYAGSAPGLAYTWVLDDAVVDPVALRQAFDRKLVLMLGEKDTSSDAAEFPRSREASELGANRFERGQAFFARATAQAGQLGQPLQWRLRTVPGVGHNSREMARAAAPVLFPESR